MTGEGGEGGSSPLVSDPALCDNHDDLDSQSISNKKRCLRFDPLKPPYTHTHSCHLRLLCKTQGRDEWTHPLSQSNLTNTESYECLKLIFSCQSCENDWLDWFPRNGEDCMQPNFTTSLKRGVWTLNLCPCLFLDLLHNKNKSGGKTLFWINRDLKRKPQERNSPCCASKIQEKGKVCIEKRVFFMQPNWEKQGEKTVTPLPAYNKFQNYRTNNVIFLNDYFQSLI